MKRYLPVPLGLLILVVAAPLRAVEPLAAQELERLCDGATELSAEASTPEAQLCILYVNGFLDGAVATDERVARNVADEIDREETLSERAIRTRIIRRLEVAGPTGYAEFCVGEPVPIVEVIDHVNAEFDERGALDGVAAQDIVYGALRRHYPCRQ